MTTIEMVHDFEVIELDSLFSDGHSLFSVILKLPYGNLELPASSLKNEIIADLNGTAGKLEIFFAT